MQTISYEFSENSNSILSEESPFHINTRSSEISLLFRVIGGSCVVTSKNNEISINVKSNYFYSDLRENQNSDIDFLNNLEEGIELSDYENLIRKIGFKNRKFYQSFLNEIVGAIYNEELEKHTAAYVHLYRAYEYLSYAFPMIYSSKTENFIGTFENLRKWMTNSESDGNIGELRFHKSFITSLFKGLPELSSTIDIDIRAKDEFKEAIFLSLTTKVLGWSSEEKYTPSTIKPEKISIKFPEFHSFLVNLRNRFFHYSNSRNDNLSVDDIIDSDLLFSLINKPGINYISRIFHEIIKHQI